MHRAAASRGTTTPRMSGGFSGLWMRRRRPVMRVGTAPCWASIWAISPSIRSGGCCGRTRSRWSGGGAGASAPIRRSHRRPPTLSRSICSLRRTPWCCRWTKPHIQALERAQGWLKLPNGKALTGFNHESKRHGTTTLFAALDVVTGLVKAGHYRRRRRVEFLHFMNRVVVDHPGREIHVILDNLNTHKPKHDRWLGRHKNIHFHFTPTHASWLNQVEVWFSILSSHALAGASFTSPREVRDQIDAFITAYNQDAHPFEWTKQVVFSKHPRSSYANLRNLVLGLMLVSMVDGTEHARELVHHLPDPSASADTAILAAPLTF